MEKRALARREECLTDNRGAIVVLTETGADAFWRASVPQMQAVKDLFANALTPAQVNALADVLDSLKHHLATKNAPE